MGWAERDILRPPNYEHPYRSVIPVPPCPDCGSSGRDSPKPRSAQTDEIQVYDAEIEECRQIQRVMVHSNFTPIGRKTADFGGGIIPDDSVNGAVEWAYGVTPWMEQGLYLPVYSAYSKDRGGSINGFKIRELFVRPHALEHTFFYGVNF